jgi:hypothetical protein
MEDPKNNWLEAVESSLIDTANSPSEDIYWFPFSILLIKRVLQSQDAIGQNMLQDSIYNFLF